MIDNVSIRLKSKEKQTLVSNDSYIVYDLHQGTCPVCGDRLHTLVNTVRCSECATIHHLDCYKYNGVCATYGCQSRLVEIMEKSVTLKEDNEIFNFQIEEPSYLNSEIFGYSMAIEHFWQCLVIFLPFLLFLIYRHDPTTWLVTTLFMESYILNYKLSYVEPT